MKKNLFKKLFCLCLCLSLCVASVMQCYASGITLNVTTTKSIAQYTYDKKPHLIQVKQRAFYGKSSGNITGYLEGSKTVYGNYTTAYSSLSRPSSSYVFIITYAHGYVDGEETAFATCDAS